MIYLIRHGQTALNHANVLQGRSDQPLNENGERQAREVGEVLRARGIVFDRVYSSPLIRAQQTARLIAGDVPLEIDERLIEMDYGPYEGLDLSHLPPEILAFFGDFAHVPAPGGMEQLSSVVERLGLFLEDIRDIARKENILISTHAIAMKGALEYLTPASKGSYWSKYIGNCAIYTASADNGSYTVPVELVLTAAV